MNFFLSGLQKLEERAKKCIELCGEYVEYIPSWFTATCILPGRAKDLSAPACSAFRRTERVWGVEKTYCNLQFVIQKLLRPIVVSYKNVKVVSMNKIRDGICNRCNDIKEQKGSVYPGIL